MYTNVSSSVLLSLAPLGISDANIYPAFLFGTITYLLIMFFNLLVLAAIVVSKKLHKPMFILLFNLPITDMIGATAFFPHLVYSVVTQDRLISQPACITQAFLIHFYGTGNFLILSSMAYDRYVAICCPLRYNAVMTPQNLIKIIASIWVITFSIIVTLILLLARFRMCRTHVVDLFCNNPSLLKLVCDDIRVNNYYGLVIMCLIQGGALAILIYTYLQILRTCVMTNHPDARRKALQTCGSHLVVFLLLQFNSVITLIAHRIESASPYMRRVLGVSVVIFPPFFDPIIYGLKITELKQGIKGFLRRGVASMKG
ncbi:olfactory receptor 52B2-like [Platichthys flesus]|uniref:olfactory receptor 52B2-like n=1 Tax=Platichthys flesus TaxID=8260 RepID=UPI002DB83A77|nr:olfactory receptor 52B2-like [Platichthys flesus]